MGVLQDFQKVRVRVLKCYRASRISGYCGTGIKNSQSKFRGKTCCTRTRDIVARVLRNSQKFRVRVWGSYRTSRTSGNGYEGLAKHTELPGSVAPAYRTSRSSGHGYGCPTKVTEVLRGVIPGVNTTGMGHCVLYRQNEKRKFGYGYEYRTELTQPFRVRVGLYTELTEFPEIRVILVKIPASNGQKHSKLAGKK